jgi:hypothetical protein
VTFDDVRLLPTPQAADGDGGRQERGAMSAGGVRPSGQKATLPLPTAVAMRETISDSPFATGTQASLFDAPEASGEAALLPTPTTQDAANTAGPSQHERNSDPLNVTATKLLPTPQEADGDRTSEHGRRHYTDGDDDPTLLGAARRSDVSWGVYEAAVRRWESVLGRPAPAPTDEKGRLAPEFVEWMLGYDEGWFDIEGLKRTAKLRALGNSVQVQVGEAVGRWARDDGWILRGDYIWARPNPMPSSVQDRCTVAHSYVFHLVKRPEYYWDGLAIAEEAAYAGAHVRASGSHNQQKAVGAKPRGGGVRGAVVGATRIARSVWTIPTEPSALGICSVCLAYWTRNAPENHCGVPVVQHYAAFPSALVERCVLAASSERGVCPDCGAPWRRLVEKGDPALAANTWSPNGAADQDEDPGPRSTLKHVRVTETVGWQATCGHGHDPVPATVLDPFAGSGTTLLVARRLGRHAVGVELNPLYCEIVARRLAVPDAVARAAETSTEPVQLVLG